MHRKNRIHRLLALAAVAALLLSAFLPVQAFAQDDPPPADLVDDEGGPVVITGDVTYTNPFFTLGVAAPMIILEDQAGFVDRNEGFIFPPESQTIGQITSDFFESPFSYSLALPIEPQGTLRDVDQDDQEDPGVMTFAIAYWTNTFGGPFLEVRDMYGGGWSTAYASTRVSEEWETRREYTGGKVLVYAPDDQQGFPSGFGEDAKLFTEDDPIVTLPQGYTIVNMDTDPFTFSREREAVIDLIEPEGSALDDYSQQSYAEAFDSLIEKMRTEYAFTEYKGLDWDALRDEFRPRFEEADANNDSQAYREALRDFSWSIPDGHVNGYTPGADFQRATAGGLGIAIRDVDDGRTIVNFLTPGSPADEAGIELGAEILEINGKPVDEAVDEAVSYRAPFSTEHVARLSKLRYAVRGPLGTDFKITYKNPGDKDPTTTTLTTVDEPESFAFSSYIIPRTGFELPVEYKLLEDSGYGYVSINSFADNDLLSIQLWERMMQTLNGQGVPGLIIDMRSNAGGSAFLADQMPAYFFDEELELGNTGYYDESTGQFEFDPRTIDRFYLPDPSLRYHGKVAVLVGPNCNSACEFFSYDMTRQDRAAIVGQYPTAGLGGSVNQVLMPENIYFQLTIGRAVDDNGNIHIEGKGVAPTVKVPVTEDTLFSNGDPVLEAAIDWLNGATNVPATDAGDIAVGDSVEGELVAGERVAYTLEVAEGDVIDITATDESGELDTVIRLYSTDGELLLEQDDSADGGPNAELVDLEIPVDLTLVLEIATAGDALDGAYTLSVVESK